MSKRVKNHKGKKKPDIHGEGIWLTLGRQRRRDARHKAKRARMKQFKAATKVAPPIGGHK